MGVYAEMGGSKGIGEKNVGLPRREARHPFAVKIFAFSSVQCYNGYVFKRHKSVIISI